MSTRQDNPIFNDKNYVPFNRTETYIVIRDGVEVQRTRTRRNLPIDVRPDYAVAAMTERRHGSMPSNNRMTKSPWNKRGKQIRAISTRVFTKLGIQLIKDGFKDQIINPISRKILKGYTFMLKHNPQ